MTYSLPIRTIIAYGRRAFHHVAALRSQHAAPDDSDTAFPGEASMSRCERIVTKRRDVLGVAGAALAAAIVPLPVLAQGVQPLKIGMIGSGREGSALGTLFAKAGHKVMFSSRHPDELKGLVEGIGPAAQAGSVEQAIAFADVVAIVVPYTSMQQIGKDYAAALAGKQLVLDVSNPVERRDGADIVKWVNEQGGAALATAKILPGSKTVRALNAINYLKLTSDANRPGELVGVPIAGDDAKAIAIASGLIREIGYEPVLIGGLAMGKYLVPGTPLSGEHTAAEIRQIAATLH
jgi:predicted dinucleotide-binding enzyme